MDDTAPIYLFDRRQEHRRLAAQAELFDPLTERVFRAAGLGPGMRVLDLGCGVGDTAMLAARIVGPEGAVVGVDVSAERLAVAHARATAAGLENVKLVCGDVLDDAVAAGERFDAVVGRLILMYLPDPVALLRSAAGRVRPGGVVCFHELDATFSPCHPPTPGWDQARAWFLETARRARVRLRMGPELYSAFVAAGLPGPELRLEAAIAGGTDAPAFAWADVFSGMVPLMERFGTATADEVGPATLTERLLQEVNARDGVVIAPLLFGAWARTPPAPGHVNDFQRKA
jgi:ubiquinone/menaquinone biosynthesis C-methylase UbiE